MKNPNDRIGNRTRELPARSAVRQTSRGRKKALETVSRKSNASEFHSRRNIFGSDLQCLN